MTDHQPPLSVTGFNRRLTGGIFPSALGRMTALAVEGQTVHPAPVGKIQQKLSRCIRRPASSSLGGLQQERRGHGIASGSIVSARRSFCACECVNKYACNTPGAQIPNQLGSPGA
jgi:hypothetical protein